jgi:hypothetical protein
VLLRNNRRGHVIRWVRSTGKHFRESGEDSGGALNAWVAANQGGVRGVKDPGTKLVDVNREGDMIGSREEPYTAEALRLDESDQLGR